MEKLSSKFLYYQQLVILTVAPVLLYFFVNFSFYKTSPYFVMLTMYGLLGIIFIRAWINIFRFKEIEFDDSKIIIISYFTNKSIKVPISDVSNIKEVYALFSKKRKVMFYKIIFTYENKVQSVLFYKSLELFGVDDLEQYIGLEKNNDNQAD